MSLTMKLFFCSLFTLTSAFAQDLKGEAMALWQKRDDKASLESAITKFEQLHKANPADTETAVYLMRSHFIMADAHNDDMDKKKKHFEKAFTIGDESLARNADYAAALKKGEDIEEAVKKLGAQDVPVMYWTAASIGKFARATGIMASMKYKSKILALIGRVEKLQPDYFYGSVPRYWGSYYAVIPGIAGKDLKKSRDYFAKALKMGPEYYGTKVLKAETYFVEKEDEKEFKALLNEVINDKSQLNHPELGPENRMEQVKAAKLLKKMDDLF